MKSSPAVAPPVPAQPVRRRGDLVFSGTALAAGLLILVALAAVALFLVGESLPALGVKKSELPVGFATFLDYAVPLVFGTVWAALLALVIAVPLSVGIALFISHYAPRRVARGLGYVIDLLAAVPSVVYGLWGITVLAPFVQPFYTFLNSAFG